MTTWIPRLFARLSGVLALMLLVEFAAFIMYREQGLSRLLWVPVSYALVAFGGFDTVKRMPLVWGALVGAVLAGATNVLSWMIGSYVVDGKFAWPDEAQPMLVGTSLLIASIVGAIIGVAAGTFARGRRRKRSRRSALGKLAYGAYDEVFDDEEETPSAMLAMPMAERAERR